jgi:hypothetical protein
MIARTVVAAAASLAVGLASAGCISFTEIAVETPITAKLDVTPFQRVLVAGFVGGGSRSLDASAETARLLRSQLRSKSTLRVIDADTINLVEELDRRRQGQAAASADSASTAPRIETEKDLEAFDQIFNDAEYWKKIGAEHQGPLIITGTVLFSEVSRSGMISKPRPVVNQLGQTVYEERREFANQKGFSLAPKFIFIDGRTGQQLHSETFLEEALYNDSVNTPALSSYFELMDKLLPGFLNTLSTQKIRGTRILVR